MGYDDILSSLGAFGKYQHFIFFLLCLNGIVCAIHAFSGVFLLAQPRFRCALPLELLNATGSNNYALAAELWETSYDVDATSGSYRSCEYLITENSSEKCSSYIYDDSVYASSAVTEWNLVCERSWLVATNQALLMVGILLGSIIFGQLADKYGRQPILMVALVLQVVSGVLAGVAPDFISFTIARMFIGSTITGVFITAYVLATEMVTPHYRLLASVAMMISYSLGAILTSVFAYFIRDWRWLQVAMSLPGLLFLPYKWIIPESTRWLISTQQNERARYNIEQLARKKGIKISTDIMDTLLPELTATKPTIVSKQSAAHSEHQQHTLMDLLKLPNMRRKSIQIFFNWFVITATFYGLSWHTSLLGENDLLNFAISSLIEIPAHSSLLLILNRLGRRAVLCGNLLLSGLGLLLTTIVPNDMNWLTICFVMVGKFGITAAFGTIYIFSAEQFPTVVRNVGLGASSMIARFGGILAPYIFLLSQVWHPLPLVVCGALTFMAGMLTLLLPETMNKPTLETLADGENFTRKKSCTSHKIKKDLQQIES